MKSPLKTDSHYYYQTAGWRVYPSSGQIQRASDELRLGPIAMQVLVALLERPGQVVTRNELFDLVWKNQEVSDDALTRCISDLRAMLGHHPTDSPLIQTLPKRGYRWLPAVEVQQLTQSPDGFEAASSSSAVTSNESAIARQAGSEPVPLTADLLATPEVVPQARLGLGATNWRTLLGWILLSLTLLCMMTFASVWWLRSSNQSNYVGVALLSSQISRPELSGLGRELDQHLKRQVLASQRLRYLSQRALSRSSPTYSRDLRDQFASKWQIESQLNQYDQVMDVSLSLVDSRTELVLLEKSQQFRLQPSSAIAASELKALALFSQEFIQEVEKLLVKPGAD